MAATALDIVTLNDAKQQLGIPTDDNNQDAYITGLINAAVTYVEQTTGRTLIDKTIVERFYPDYPNNIISLRADGVIFNNDDTAASAEVTVSYYDDNQELQTVNTKASRGISDTPFQRESVFIMPPEGGWKFGVGNTPYGTLHFIQLTLKGPASADVPPPMKNAALLIIDTLYSGSALDAIPSNNAVELLLSSYRKVVM